MGATFEALAAKGSGADLTPRQTLLLCLAVLRGGKAVYAERLEADLKFWVREHGAPTATSVEKWINENRELLGPCARQAVERFKSK